MLPEPQFTRYFPTPHAPLTSALGADQLSRAGIYILHLDDGTEYVGKALDVSNRYRAHQQRWGSSIRSIDFATVRPSLLNIYEFLVILQRQSQGAQLNNDLLAQLPYGVPRVDADRLKLVQMAVLSEAGDETCLPLSVPSPREATPRAGARRLLESDDGQEVILLLAYYLIFVLPCPAETEELFWRVSAPMRRGSDAVLRLATLTVQNQKVLEVYETPQGPVASVVLSPRPELRTYYSVETSRRNFPTGLPMRLVHMPATDVVDALCDDPGFLAAGRGAVRNCVLAGPHTAGSTHDKWLADTVYSCVTDLIKETP